MHRVASTLANKAGIRHAFFTREGGVSQGIYASLNCGFSSGDRREDVAENRRRALQAVALAESDLVTLHQVHSATVVPVNGPWTEGAPRADAMVTNRPGMALGILTADCAPVLLADEAAGVVGAAHAGWRGALSGVLQATIAAMCSLGANLDRISAAIGPCITQPSYEVGPEFPEHFKAADIGNLAYFVPSARDGHWQFDLPSFAAEQLRRAGLADVHRLDDDTCSDESFFSYRRATHNGEPDYGRNLSVIATVPA